MTAGFTYVTMSLYRLTGQPQYLSQVPLSASVWSLQFEKHVSMKRVLRSLQAYKHHCWSLQHYYDFLQAFLPVALLRLLLCCLNRVAVVVCLVLLLSPSVLP